MFTGLVQAQARVVSITEADALARLTISVENEQAKALLLGASIAINGVCLTVVSYQEQSSCTHINFDIISETLQVTNLGALKVGDMVNLERSLKMGDELGGHIVSGHVQTTAHLANKVQTDTNCTLTFIINHQWMAFIVHKGFITINGISLTVGEVGDDKFCVHLIPETLARTNLSRLAIGDQVNIECDQQTVTIVNTLKRLDLTKLIS
ncbi:riboflavin synthase subunit alpha [Thalassotalea ganghwensis]